MSTEQLKDLLSNMADDVEHASVHQRAAAKSQRLLATRTALAGVIALALLGGGAAGATVLSPTDGSGKSNTAASDEMKLDGTIISAGFSDGNGEWLESWETDTDKPTKIDVPKDGLYYNTGSLSPDGRKIAYHTKHSEAMVTDLKSGKETKLGKVSKSTTSIPAWAPDGERVFIDKGKGADERFGFVDVATGKFKASQAQPPGSGVQVSSSGGQDVFYSIADSTTAPKVVRTDADGKTTETGLNDVAKRQPENNNGEYIREITAVSADGRMACLSTDTEPNDNEDPSMRWGTCDLIVDLKKEKAVKLDFPNGEVNDDSSWFGTPAIMSVKDHFVGLGNSAEAPIWQLYDYDGKLLDGSTAVIDPSTEPLPLGYIPND